MSFLLRTLPRQSAAVRFTPLAPQAFSTSFVQRKSATETVKDTVKTVDRAVSDKLVDGIEVGRTVTFLLSINPLTLPTIPIPYLSFPLSPPSPPSSPSPTSPTHQPLPLFFRWNKSQLIPPNRNRRPKSQISSRHVRR